jgi:phospholipid/cholesterol/gamma-HCH transport system permease protein
MKYLTVPRVLAGTIAVPALVGIGDAIGIFGGYVVGVYRLGFNSAAYLKNTADYLQSWDVTSGLIKGAAFGFLVTLMGCYYGMNSGRGAQGVGRSTKAAVVAASVLILAANYLLTSLFFTE